MVSDLFREMAEREKSLLADKQGLEPVLRERLDDSVGIGTGNITSKTYPYDHVDHQWDVVIHDASFSKLASGENAHSFPIESVFCTIEVKSKLDEDEYLKSANAAAELNYRWKLHSTDMTRRTPRRFLFAYDGPEHMETVAGWMKGAYADNQRQSPNRPLREGYFDGSNELKRSDHVSSSLDGIFVLGRGFVAMDSFGFRFQGASDHEPEASGRHAVHWFNYVCADGKGIALASMALCLIDVFGGLNLIDESFQAIEVDGKLEFVVMPSPRPI
ncbi:DUF6602 domain-containing protein [Burkholderia sp. Ac-20379]|uniref:DUF6602 domain-containing protein n=1 Tax=Burkholderia sp. Ac-20379 TaxID=2703900 RepID=UPI00197F35A2|nr:DUF6602 domain-containing protein [Burkholderia sp. Ac-20379]MBN3726734.1 hypothetical protein [Burkholderia sp. Ac-20379]